MREGINSSHSVHTELEWISLDVTTLSGHEISVLSIHAVSEGRNSQHKITYFFPATPEQIISHFEMLIAELKEQIGMTVTETSDEGTQTHSDAVKAVVNEILGK